MKKYLNIYFFLSILLAISACTEDRQIETILKPEDQILSKSKIDQEALYLYVPLGQESSRTSLYGRAYEVGQSKVVKLEINEFSLDVVSIEKEARFGDNENNQKVLLSIPIEHVDYRCAEDSYGECLDREIENNRVTWEQKTYFKPNFSDTTVSDTNFFAYEFAGPRSCYEEEQTEVLSRSLDEQALHFTLKRNYKDQLFFFCIRNHDLTDFTNLNWTETTSYSLVKLDSVASPNYQNAIYHPNWINTFGFFEVDNNKLDVDGNSTQSGEIKYIQRWNPNRSNITYHLSEAFSKPENSALKAATYESFRRINLGLKKAGVQFQLNIEEPSEEISPGDLRNSMIVLVDDPVASSVIGYGPSITNPLTGEVISARTVMYSGSIRKFVRFTYEDILQKHQQEQQAEQQIGPAAQSLLGTNDIEGLKSAPLLGGVNGKQSAKFMEDLSRVVENIQIQQENQTPDLSDGDIQNYLNQISRRDFIADLAKNNKYPAEAMNFGDISQELVQEVIKEVGQLQPWELLDNEKKQNVLDILTPYVWIPTLVHEIGHNLGLRHNFSGSEDTENFYTAEELAEFSVPVSEGGIPYSSVMDYPKSEINALRTLGKYDIAALRFGYAQQVTLADGDLAKVTPSESPIEGIKSYSYCSDEGVAPNPTCNPFDEGESMVDITNSLIESYKERYATANFRRGRANFSGLNDDLYLRRISRTFGTLRLIYERYESLVREFQLDQATIDAVPFLKDIDEAVAIAANFLIEVVATPDTTCIVMDNTTGGLQVAPIGIFSSLAHDRTRDCSQLQLNDRFMVIGQGGKPLNSLKLPTNPNRFADQIDIRGVWIDKALAMRTLFQRTIGSTLHDDYNGNFMDHPASSTQIVQFLGDLMTNSLITPVDLSFITGERFAANLAVNFDESFYEVPAGELPIANIMLRIPYDNMHLPEMLTQIMSQGIYQGSDSDGNDRLKEALKVFTSHPDPGSREYLATKIQGQPVFAHQSSGLSARLIAQSNLAEFYESTGLSSEDLLRILDLLENPPKTSVPSEEVVEGEETPELVNPVESLTPTEKEVYDLGLASLQRYLANPTRSSYLKRILKNLY